MAVVGVLEIQMIADMARLSNDLKRANGEITSAVRGFNNILNTLGVGISFAFFADLARRSNEFEKSLAKISTQIDDTTGDIDRLANSAKNFAAQFGTAQVEQTNAYYEIISAGIEDTAKATEILNTANKLAIGGMTSLGVSVDGLTNIMNSYAGKVESADAVSDALFIGMKAGKATMEELSSGLGKVTPLAATLNVSFDELVAVIATLSKQGIQTSESITGVRAILSAVAKPASEAAKLAGELGLEFNAASLQAKGFAGFIQDVISKTDGSTTALSTLFGRVEALVPVLSLAGTGGQDFNNILGQMGGKAGATQEAFEKMAASPGFKVDQLMAAISNAAITLGAKLSDVLTPAIVKVTQAFNNLFLTQEQSPLEKQIALISSLEKKLAALNEPTGVPILDDIYSNFLFNKRTADLYEQQLEDARADLLKLQQAQQSAASSSSNLKTEVEELTGTGGGNTGVTGLGTSVDKTKQKMDSFVESIRKQAAEAGKTANEIKRMEAANLGVLRVVEPYLDIIEAQAVAEEDLRISRQKQADDLRKIEQLTQSVRTKQEIYNDTVKELDDLLSKGLGMEAYNRALKTADEQLAKTESSALDRSRNFWDSNEQIWIQGVRNVQSSLANGLFNVFDDGLSGMVSGVKRAVGQMIAEFASMKILQASGIAGLLGMGSTAAMASGGSGLVGSFGAGLSGDALGGFINGGFSNSAASAASIGSFLNQNTNLTYGGIAFAASSAAGNSDITKGVATALATFGGPYGAIAAAVVIALDILNKNFGDHEISKNFQPVAKATQVIANPFYGAEYGINQFEKILGTNIVSKALPGYFVEDILGLKSPDTLIANALFGRGQFKLQNQQFQADIGADGIQNAALIESYKAKGSVFRSSRTDNIIIDAITGNLLNEFGDITESGISSRLQPIADARIDAAFGFTEIINDALAGIGSSMRGVAKNLDIGTQGLENFSTKLTILSEKGELISQEDFSDEIARITDEMALSLFPAIAELAERGEGAADALKRLNSETLVLTDAASVVLGKSIGDANDLINSFSFDDRSDFIKLSGGVEELSQKVSGFFEILEDSEKLKILEDRLLTALDAVGINFIPTMDQFKEAMQSGQLSVQQFIAGLDLRGLIKDVNDLRAASYQLIDASTELPEKLGDELGDAIEELEKKSAGADRAMAKLARRLGQIGEANTPTIAANIGGKIFTEAEIRAMQDAAIQSAFESSRAAVSEQLSRLNQAMQVERNAMRERVAAVKDTIRFFDKFKESALDISNASFAAARAQLDSAITLVKAGASFEQIDTPELSAAIDALKQDRSGFFESRKAFEQEKADTAAKLRELADAGTAAADQTINILTEQLSIMQRSYDLQVQQLNGLLGFINLQAGVVNPTQAASLSTDEDLAKLLESSVKGLNESERIRRNTTFNGSVQFASPAGTNESADNADRARLSTLNTFKQSARGGDDISSDILTELKNLKKESGSTKQEISKLFNMFNNVTNGGNAMKTVAG